MRWRISDALSSHIERCTSFPPLGLLLLSRNRLPVSALPPIVLQNSKVAGLRIFLENAKRGTIADSYNLNRVSEVACEFKVRRWGPSHLYTKTAPVARRIFDHQCKTTFATQSATNGLVRCGKTASRRRRQQLQILVRSQPPRHWGCSGKSSFLRFGTTHPWQRCPP